MSRTRNPFQLIEGLHGGLFDSLAATEEDELLYPESEGFDYGNIATSKKLRYSNTYEIPDRNVVLERADINSNGLMLMLNAGSPDPDRRFSSSCAPWTAARRSVWSGSRPPVDVVRGARP